MITRELYLTVRKNGKKETTGQLAMHVLVEEDGTLAEYGKEYVSNEGQSVVLREGEWFNSHREPDVWLIAEGTGEDARRRAVLPHWLGLMWRPL